MNYPLTRRDFLKIAGLLPPALASPRLLKALAPMGPAPAEHQNVIVVVFDALSAYNMSLYGYSRETTPNLARLASRAVVYHNHFAAGNYTTPGTASLLTGTLPWTHRALTGNSQVADRFVNQNIFSAFPEYFRVAYTHNTWAYTLLRQFRRDVDQMIPWAKLLLRSYLGDIETLFGNDHDIATVSGVRDIRLGDDGFAYSLFLSHLYEALRGGEVPEDLRRLFPRGLPTTGTDSDFLLEHAVDWIGNLLTTIPRPFLGYFHFFPPHGPYNTSLQFYNRFRDDHYDPPEKPLDVLDLDRHTAYASAFRRWYDEFIPYVDQQFGRFYDALGASGLLDNTWLVLTSDHGEMFERGVRGHGFRVLYQPVIRIPLLIFEPGRAVGMDIQAFTSAVDVLPTLAHVTGHAIPNWTEGIILPPYATNPVEPNRAIYAVQADRTDAHAPVTRGSATLVKGRYKLHYYFGYAEVSVRELVELYDIEADPEELVDLSSSQKDVAAGLMRELKTKLAEVNQPYL